MDIVATVVAYGLGALSAVLFRLWLSRPRADDVLSRWVDSILADLDGKPEKVYVKWREPDRVLDFP